MMAMQKGRTSSLPRNTHGQLAMLQYLAPLAGGGCACHAHHGHPPWAPWRKADGKPGQKPFWVTVWLKLPSHPVCQRTTARQLFLWLVFIHGQLVQPAGPILPSFRALANHFWVIFDCALVFVLRPHPSLGAWRDVSVLMDSTCLPWSQDSRVQDKVQFSPTSSCCIVCLRVGSRVCPSEWELFYCSPARSHLHLYLSQKRIYLSPWQWLVDHTGSL